MALSNTGTVTSTNGQAVEFAGGTGAAIQNITNSGSITSVNDDAIRIGGVGTIINSGAVNGGTAAAYSVGTDGIQFEDNASGSVANNAGGNISGDRHGINGGLGTTVTVTNAAGATITGRNGSGVGLDGNGWVTNFGTITGNFSNSAGSDINGTTINSPNGGGPDGINDGDGDGIDIDGQATIVNHGTIQGTGAGGSGSDRRLNTSEAIAAGGGSIDNRAGAIITGLGLGILIDDSTTGPAPFVTTVDNKGTISGTNSVGIRIIGLQNDTITNEGTISGGGGIAIQMGGGADTLSIKSGSSITGTSQGEDGTDTLDYSAFGSSVLVNLHAGSANNTGGVSGFEVVTDSAQDDRICGSNGVNTLSGGDDNDLLSGCGAADILNGGNGDDRLVGGTGADIMVGGAGNDIYFVDNAGDDVQEFGGGGIDTVRSSVDWTLNNNEEKLYLEGSTTTGAGNGQTNHIYGNDLANTIDGGAGADRMLGGGGGDTYTVDSTGDRMFETTAGVAGGTDTVNTSVNFALSANVENLVITAAAGQVNGTGNSLSNAITGGAGNNYIDGKDGGDTLTGGGGVDQFLFTTTLNAATNADLITDFDTNDGLCLDDALFTQIASGFLSAAAFAAGAAATTAAHRIICNSATGDVFYDSDGVGGVAQVKFANLGVGTPLTEADIFVF